MTRVFHALSRQSRGTFGIAHCNILAVDSIRSDVNMWIDRLGNIIVHSVCTNGWNFSGIQTVVTRERL